MERVPISQSLVYSTMLTKLDDEAVFIWTFRDSLICLDTESLQKGSEFGEKDIAHFDKSSSTCTDRFCSVVDIPAYRLYSSFMIVSATHSGAVFLVGCTFMRSLQWEVKKLQLQRLPFSKTNLQFHQWVFISGYIFQGNTLLSLTIANFVTSLNLYSASDFRAGAGTYNVPLLQQWRKATGWNCFFTTVLSHSRYEIQRVGG